MSRNDTPGREAAQLNIGQILRTLLVKSWLILLAAVVFAGGAYGFSSAFVTPVYDASVVFYINNNSFYGDNRLSKSDMAAAKSLVDTSIVVLEAGNTLEEVIRRAGAELTAEELAQMISARSVEETELFRIRVRGEDPAQVSALADAIAQVLPERVDEIMEGTYIGVADAVQYPDRPSSPNLTRSAINGFLSGFVLAASAVLLIELYDDRLRRVEDIRRCCESPVLGVLPLIPGDKRDKKAARRLADFEGHSAAAEGYRELRTRLRYCFADGEGGHITGVSSALTGEGKSTSAANLARVMAQDGRRVLLIDCDLRRPSIHGKLGLRLRPGLTECLIRRCEPEDVTVTWGREGARIAVIPAGQIPPNPMELLSGGRMQELLTGLRQEYDEILLDLPPVGEVSDALMTAKLADGVLLVVRCGYCRSRSLKRAVEQFRAVDAKLLGILANCAKEPKNTGRASRKHR